MDVRISGGRKENEKTDHRRAAVELDPVAATTYRKNHPDTTLLERGELLFRYELT